jgi:hypothetical protein
VEARAWSAARELLLAAPPSPERDRVHAALDVAPPDVPELVLRRLLPLAGDPATACAAVRDPACRDPDGPPALWVGDAAGRVMAVDGQGTRVVHTLDAPVRGLVRGGERLAVFSAGRLWLFAVGRAEPIATWALQHEQIEGVRMLDGGRLQVLSLDTSGHPTDRSGRRREVSPGEPLQRAPTLAWAQGRVPPPGGSGDRSAVPTPEPTGPAPRPGHPGQTLHRCYGELRWAHGLGPDATWACPEAVVGHVVAADRVQMVAGMHVYEVVCLEAGVADAS